MCSPRRSPGSTARNTPSRRSGRRARRWPPARQFIGQRAFKEILFKNGLPWVFVFDGLPDRVGDERTGPVNPDDGTVVIVGDLGASYDRNRTLFRSVGLATDAQMELADGGGQFILHDFYANPLPSRRRQDHGAAERTGLFPAHGRPARLVHETAGRRSRQAKITALSRWKSSPAT